MLRSYLRRALPDDVLAAIEPELVEMGALAGGELYRQSLAERLDEPRLVSWDAWGKRVDRIELTGLWKRAERLAAERGVVATAYERAHGPHSRVHQFALAYLFAPSTDTYACPLAMTDGAARTLLEAGDPRWIERAVPRLLSRDPSTFWTSGQWMTESTGGSDVGASETFARRDERGTWRLYGRKWFTSAAASPMALTLARPEGNPPGGHGLAMFYVETRDANGALRYIQLHRLKDKLGTRKLPTAELALEGTPAELVGERTGGVRAIAPMLNITRTWNSVTAIAGMRRGIALARDYAKRRRAFGATLAEKPLHVDTLAGLQAEFEAGFHLAFFVVELLGRAEASALDDQGRALLRLLTPITKLTTARQAVNVASEVLEAFGGAGYVEDTGLPVLLRDAQVLSIWEGTTNVLALDALRAIARDPETSVALRTQVATWIAGLRDPSLVSAGRRAEEATAHALDVLASDASPTEVEAGARRWALTVGRACSLALLARHAQWSLDHEGDLRARAAALRFAATPFDLSSAFTAEDSAMLANDRVLPPSEEVVVADARE